VSPALAGTPPPVSAGQVVSDDTLAQIRGKYVPPPHANYGAAVSPVSAVMLQNPMAARAASAANPLSSIASSQGTVTYFGVEMISTWTQAGVNGTQGVSAGLNLGFDLAQGNVTIAEWSSSTNGGLATTSASGTIDGSATSNLSGGVGQNIQVAGNGNSIANTATVTVNGADPFIVVPTTNTCGTQCAITIGSNAAGISISTPQGTVLQSIGPNGILQSAQVSSDMNVITNQLGVHVQTSGAPTFTAGSLLPILQTLNGLP
jgi:hypothetical protein